jgi:hypothetical protein
MFFRNTLASYSFPWFRHFQLHVAFGAAIAFFALLFRVHRAGMWLNGLFHRSATLGAFSAHFAGALFVYGATKDGGCVRLHQGRVAFGTGIAFLAGNFRMHRAGVTGI